LEAKLIFQFLLSVVVPVFAYLKAVLYLQYAEDRKEEGDPPPFPIGGLTKGGDRP
jgi:hypothetical protein